MFNNSKKNFLVHATCYFAHSCYTVSLSLPPPKKEVMFLVRSVCLSDCLSVCLSVCPSDYSQTCERILTKFFVGVGHGSKTKWYNFGGDPDHASDPGVQSPKSGSSLLLTNCVMPCSAEVCALWVYSRYQWYIHISEQWYQLPEFIPSNSNSGLHLCDFYWLLDSSKKGQ